MPRARGCVPKPKPRELQQHPALWSGDLEWPGKKHWRARRGTELPRHRGRSVWRERVTPLPQQPGAPAAAKEPPEMKHQLTSDSMSTEAQDDDPEEPCLADFCEQPAAFPPREPCPSPLQQGSQAPASAETPASGPAAEVGAAALETAPSLEDRFSGPVPESKPVQCEDPRLAPQAGREPCGTDFCEETVVVGLARSLEQLISFAPKERVVTCFHSNSVPAVGICSYVVRLRRLLGCSLECYVLGFLYMDRAIALHPSLVISRLTCHRLLLTSLVIAAKFHDDKCFSNKFYAKAGGIHVSEMNGLERKMLQLLDHKLLVHGGDFEVYRSIVFKAASAALTSKPALQ